MAFTPEQISEIKKQLINQINSTFPEDKKSESISRIEAMNDSEIIQFLEENQLIKDESGHTSSAGNCVFCSIAHGKINSAKISEDNNSVAVLEINPLSKGHAIIIPKDHSHEISAETESFAEEIKKTIKNSLKPKEIVTEHSELFGHKIINLIPVYGETMETERKKSSHEELEKIKEEILSYENNESKPEKNKEKIIEIPKPKEISDKKIKIPKRIP